MLVSAALDSATPAALLAGAIDVEQAPRPLSVFDLMRIGIGPSSSHTVGPMRAGRAFSRALAEAVRPGGAGDSDGECASLVPGTGLPQPTRVTVELYGSLGATGRGHATDRAAVMGLAGYEPETVPAVVCESLMEEVEAAGELVVDGVGPIPFSPSADIHFLPGRVLPYHVNGMTLTAYCASACGCATTCRMSAICPVRDISTCRTGTVISAVIRSGVFRNRSWVRVTDPSVEFSMGTTPKSTVPASVTRNTSSMDAQGTPSTASPKRARMACSLNVPQGPRKATRSGRSSPRQADISSRQSERIAVSGNGPGLAACSLRMMAASRSGR